MSNLKDFAEGFVLPKPRSPLRPTPKARARPKMAQRLPVKGIGDARYRGVGIPDAIRVMVAERSDGYCEVRGSGCLGDAHQMHHRKMRSQGGPHTYAQIVDACMSCHRVIHANPADSYASGLLVRRADPTPTEPWERD